MANAIDLTQIGIVIYTSKEDISKQFLCQHEAETEYQIADNKSIRATLKSVSYSKKIYEPCSLTCTIQLESIDKKVTPIEDVIQLARSFKGKKVSAFRGGFTNNIAENYFVYRSIPTHEKDDAVSVTLEVYSMDKLLDTMSYSRSYVSRKLRAEILGDAIARCKFGDLIVPVANDDELQYTSYGENENKKEFVQPYIVQFNETPYSMLRRTANRSGEFLFFESGGIHLGLPKANSIPEVGNEDESQMRFKSVSYSEAITADFGSDLQYQSDDYEQINEEAYFSTLLEYAEAPFAASLEQLKKSLAKKSDQDEFQSSCDIYATNKKYRDLYDRAKSVVESYKCLSASLQNKQDAKAELCDENNPDSPSQKALVNKAPACLLVKLKMKQESLKEKENELQQLDENKKKYAALDAECQALKKNWKEDPADPSDIEKQKKYTLYSEKQAELNLLIENQGSISEMNQKTDACLVEIMAQKKEITELNTIIDTINSPNFTDDEKYKVLSQSQYLQEVKDHVNEQIKKLQDDIDEISNAIERLKEEPEELKRHKDEPEWMLFVEWADFFGSEAEAKLNNIWTSVYDNGNVRYPFNIQMSVAGIKKMAKGIMEGTVELSDDAKADEKSLQHTCKSIISYCDAILYSEKPKDDIKTEKSVYHLEYGNDEYLETFKRDQTGNYISQFVSDYSAQNTPLDAEIAKFTLHCLGEFLCDASPWTTSLGSIAYLDVIQPMAVNAIFFSWLHDQYNTAYLDEYEHNGQKVKDTEYGGSDEISLFATYNKTTKVYKTSSAFSALFYKEIWNAEKRISEQKIIINIDTAVNEVSPKLGQKIKYGDKTYIIISITGNRTSVHNNLISEEIVEAIPLLEIPQESSSEPLSLIIPPVSGYPRYVKAEPQLATVVDDDDPSFYARVRVRYKWQPGGKEKKVGDEPSPWIRVSTPFASHGGGMLFIPKPGNQVMIDYENGNIERPFVSNAVYDANNRPPMPQIGKKPTRMMISSPNGHSIKFTDTTAVNTLTGLVSSFDPVIKSSSNLAKSVFGAEPGTWDVNPGGGVTISDSYGFYSINCSADKRAIKISSPMGNIGLSAFTGIKISAPNGDIKIEGKNVSISANNELKIVSGANIKQQIEYAKLKTTTASLVNGVVEAVTGLLPQVIDLSLIRHVIERAVPPVSGVMVIKSYRFLLIDAGDTDVAVESIQSNNSRRRRIIKSSNFKGWKKLNAENEQDTSLSYWNFFSMMKDNMSTAFANMVKNTLPERNNWRVDSDKDAIIIAGKVCGTNPEKTELQADFNRVDHIERLYAEPAQDEQKEKWNLAASVNAEKLDSFEKGFKISGKIFGYFFGGLIALPTLPIYGLARLGIYGFKKLFSRNPEEPEVGGDDLVAENVEANNNDQPNNNQPDEREEFFKEYEGELNQDEDDLSV